MLINFSNHPSSLWEQKQLESAKVYGELVDVPFPSIDPDADEKNIRSIAEQYTDLLLKYAIGRHLTVHIMGEMTFTFLVVTQLKNAGVDCIASTSLRDTEISPDGRKISDFQFVRFRKY